MSDATVPDADLTDSDFTRPSSAESVILKILSGVQSGVEVALSPGQYTLGSGDDDDIRIIDVSLATRHLELRVSSGGCQIRASAGQVRSGNGIWLESESDWQEVEPLDVVMVGTTRFAVAGASAAWTSVTDIPAEAPPPAAEPAPGFLAAILARLGRLEWRGRSVSRLAVPAGALLFLLLIVLWYLVPGGAPVGDEASSRQENLAQVRAAVGALPFAGNIEMRQEVDGVIYATGHVDTPAERRAVAAAIEATAIPVNLRVWVVQSMHQEIAGLIEAQARNVTVEISAAGVVTLRGLIPDDAEAARFTALVDEVPGVSEVQSRLRTPSSLLAEVEQLAQASQVKPWVLFRLDNGMIEATGSLPASEVNAWADFLQVYARRFARDIGLRSFVQLQNVNIQTNDASPAIGAITIGAQELNDGDVQIDVSRLQGGDVAPADLLVGGSTAAASSAPAPAGAAAGGQTPPASAPASMPTSVRPASPAAAGGQTSPLPAAAFAPSSVRPVPGPLFPLGLQRPSDAPASAGSPVTGPQGQPSASAAPQAPATPSSAPSVPGAMTLATPPRREAALAGAGGLAGAREAGLVQAGGGMSPFLRGEPVAVPFEGIDGVRAVASPASPAAAVVRLVPSGGASTVGADKLVGAEAAGLALPDGAHGRDALAPQAGARGADARAGESGLADLFAGPLLPNGFSGLLPAGAPAALPTLGAPPPLAGATGPVVAEINWSGAVPESDASRSADTIGDGQAGGEARVDDPSLPAGVPMLDADPFSLVARAASATLALGGDVAPAGLSGLSAAPPAGARIGASGAEETPAPPSQTAETGSPPTDAVERAAAESLLSGPPPAGPSLAEAPPAESTPAESTLADSTRLLLEQWRDGRLQQGANANTLMGALENLSRQGAGSGGGEPSRLARQQIHDRYLPASGAFPDGAPTCWPASMLKSQDIVTALFWLDILSVGDALSLSRFDVPNQMMLMEVALSPHRVTRCIAQAYPRSDIVEQSVYMRETRRNPGFVRFLLRDIPAYSLDVAGASTSGERRFILTRAGQRIGEGAFPDSASRLLTIGELGAVFETAEGLRTLVYGPELNWRTD